MLAPEPMILATTIVRSVAQRAIACIRHLMPLWFLYVSASATQCSLEYCEIVSEAHEIMHCVRYDALCTKALRHGMIVTHQSAQV